MKLDSKFLAANILLSTIFTSCQKESPLSIPENAVSASIGGSQPLEAGFAGNDMVMYWNEKAATVLDAHTNPGSDSRSFAIIEIAVHDALNNIIPKYERYALNDRDQFADPAAAVASAAYWAIKGLSRQGTFPIDQWYAESLATIQDGESKTKGIALGRKSADAILENRRNDGLSQVVQVSFFPVDGDDPGEYRSTLPASDPNLNLPHVRNVPNWGTVIRPFVTKSNYQFRPDGPYSVNTIEYTNDYNEVKNKGAMDGSTRTPEEDQLARFWSSIKHHITWNDFTRKIISTKRMDAWKTARLFALIHTGMADGASSMFEAKYHFYYWRPETAIRVAVDGNSNTFSDPAWLPSILLRPQANPLMNAYTPGVPEYPSSFGILGGITGEVLQSFFGTDEISVDMISATLPGVVLHYNSISKAVSDNAISKIFAGWYFRKASVDGEEMGQQIGSYLFTHHFREE